MDEPTRSEPGYATCPFYSVRIHPGRRAIPFLLVPLLFCATCRTLPTLWTCCITPNQYDNPPLPSPIDIPPLPLPIDSPHRASPRDIPDQARPVDEPTLARFAPSQATCHTSLSRLNRRTVPTHTDVPKRAKPNDRPRPTRIVPADRTFLTISNPGDSPLRSVALRTDKPHQVSPDDLPHQASSCDLPHPPNPNQPGALVPAEKREQQ